jgi:hypothetical protein
MAWVFSIPIDALKFEENPAARHFVSLLTPKKCAWACNGVPGKPNNLLVSLPCDSLN